MVSDSLSSDELATRVEQLAPGWQILREGLAKRFIFPNRRACAAFLVEVLRHANKANHHPDVDVHDGVVTVTYVTHSENDTITEKDVDGAAVADQLARLTPAMLLHQVISLPAIQDVRFPQMIGKIQPVKPNRRSQDKKKKRRSYNWQGLRLGRKPHDWEVAVLSLHDIVARHDTAIDQLVMTLSETRTAAVDRALSVNPVNLEIVPDDTVGVLRAAQLRMAVYGAYEVRRELRRQGAVVPEPTSDEPVLASLLTDPLLHWSVHLAASRLNVEWRSDMQRHAIRLSRARRTEEWHARATEHVAWGLKGAVRQLLHEAFAAGRHAEILRLSMLFHLRVEKRGDEWCVVSHRTGKTLGCHDTKADAENQLAAIRVQKHAERLTLREVDEDEAEELVDYVIQTAVMDTATCDPCWDVDGTIMDYDSEEQQRLEPPYYLCEGGDNCRCVQVYVLKTGGSWVVRGDEIKE